MPRSVKSGTARVDVDRRCAAVTGRPERERSAETGGDEDGAGEGQAGAQRAENA